MTLRDQYRIPLGPGYWLINASYLNTEDLVACGKEIVRHIMNTERYKDSRNGGWVSRVFPRGITITVTTGGIRTFTPGKWSRRPFVVVQDPKYWTGLEGVARSTGVLGATDVVAVKKELLCALDLGYCIPDRDGLTRQLYAFTFRVEVGAKRSLEKKAATEQRRLYYAAERLTRDVDAVDKAQHTLGYVRSHQANTPDGPTAEQLHEACKTLSASLREKLQAAREAR